MHSFYNLNIPRKHIEHDMSKAYRHLKSSRSLSGITTHPPMVTQRSTPWSWMDAPFTLHTMSIGPDIPEVRLFQTLTLKLQGQGHGWGPIVHWVSDRYTSFSFRFNGTNHYWDVANTVWPWKKHICSFWTNWQKKFPRQFLQNLTS